MKKGENVKMRKFAAIFLIVIAIVSMSKPYGIIAWYDNDVDYIIINGNQSKDELYMIKGLNSEITCTSGSVFGTVNEPNHGTRIHTLKVVQ